KFFHFLRARAYPAGCLRGPYSADKVNRERKMRTGQSACMGDWGFPGASGIASILHLRVKPLWA
ncbi:hypothetical protein CSW44_07100, partial [Thermus scotoductus]